MEQPPDDRGSDADLGTVFLLTGLAALFVAGLAWWEVSAAEAAGGGRMNILIALAYRIGGAKFTVGLFAVPGVAMVAAGIYFLRRVT